MARASDPCNGAVWNKLATGGRTDGHMLKSMIAGIGYKDIEVLAGALCMREMGDRET